jgi:hypothetical protein
LKIQVGKKNNQIFFCSTSLLIVHTMSDNEAPQAVEGVDFFVDLGNAKQSFLINRVFKVHLLLGVAITAASFLRKLFSFILKFFFDQSL